MEYRDAFAVISYNGDVLWIPQAIFKSSCVIDITHFPFDEQNCFLKFGSWTYDGFKLDLDFFDELEEVDLNDYIVSNEWGIIEHPAKKHNKFYPCCKVVSHRTVLYLTKYKRNAQHIKPKTNTSVSM